MNKEFLKMQKLAGLITESQMQNKLKENSSEDNVPLTPEVKQYIDDAIAELRASHPGEEWAKLERGGFWENEFVENTWMHFEDKFPEALDLSDEAKEYIDSKVYGA